MAKVESGLIALIGSAALTGYVLWDKFVDRPTLATKTDVSRSVSDRARTADLDKLIKEVQTSNEKIQATDDGVAVLLGMPCTQINYYRLLGGEDLLDRQGCTEVLKEMNAEMQAELNAIKAQVDQKYRVD